MWKLVILMVLGLLVACDERATLAPVVEGSWRADNPSANFYRVRSGDTLYSIAFRYDQDYRRLAAMNALQSPYVVKVGQVIHLKSQYMTAPTPRIVYMNRRAVVQQQRSRPHLRQPQSQPALSRLPSNAHWSWPVHGAILSSFSPEMGRKGIDIAGKKGQTIRATASGTVSYAGDGITGYGNLILIQHPKQLLSAYGYNARNLVHAGQTVHAGQAIAIIGVSPKRRYAMHFEVRKAGQPVNPGYFLSKGYEK
jgi:lipoprotein NlpD